MPSSLTTLLPLALGFSPHLPVSVYGTGTMDTIAAFLDGWLHSFATCFSLLSPIRIACGVCLTCSYLAFTGLSFPRLCFTSRVPTVLIHCSTGISTCCPLATRFRLALGPDLPGADQLYPGNLGYSALKILTLISLLIPAFSLDGSPRLLAGTASMCRQCSSTNTAYPAHNRRFLKGFPFGISSAAIRRIDDIPLLRWRV